MTNESLSTTSVLVRDWNCKNMTEITIKEWEEAEKKAGKTSAFAETRSVLANGIVSGTEMTVEKYLQYRNK